MRWTQDDVIAAAFATLEQEGLEGLSLRGVARVLGAHLNSVSWYVKSKHSLIEKMADAIVGSVGVQDLPAEPIELLGDTGSRRIDTLVHDVVESSARAGDIVQSDEIGEAMLALRSFMFERVYHAQDHGPARKAVRRIFAELVDERGLDAEAATDYLAGMTDRFALSYAAELD